MSARGEVVLVGAGPGNPALLTLGGLRALERADVVLFDRLAGEALLDHIPDTALRVDVGKRGGEHPVPQAEITALLIEHARAGKRVVRLKGGDPFLFGRGGEELDAVSAAGIPCRVLPGVTAAIAAPAWAGIPVTHRDHASSVHILTGHAREDRPPSINFDALARLGGTLVFMMGVGALDSICAGLLAAGMPPSTPAALVQDGTLPTQRLCAATLATLPAHARAARIAPPAVLVVGEVCALAGRYAATRPLRGKRLLAAGTAPTVARLAAALDERGAVAVPCACVGAEPLPLPSDLPDGLDRYHWLALTSERGVHRLFEELRARSLDARALAGPRIAAVGENTANTLAAYGIAADLVPETFGGEALARAMAQSLPADGRVLLLRAQHGAPALPQTLRALDIPFDDIPLYRTVPLPVDEAAMQNLRRGQCDALALLSPSAARALADAAGRKALRDLPAFCIGPHTAEQARALGIRDIRCGESAAVESLADQAEQYWGVIN